MKIWFFAIMLATALFGGEKVYATFDVVASKNATLSLEVSGIIKKVYVDVGSYVNKGDILAEIDNATQNNDLTLAIRDEKIAQINFERAKANYARYEKVKGVIDEFRLDGFRFDMLSAEANYEKAKATVEAKKTNLQKTYLKAPFSGIIANKHIEVGDGINSMTLTPAFEIISTGSQKLVLSFDEKYHKIVKAGNIFTFNVDGHTKQLIGKISKVYPQVDPKTRMAKAEVIVSKIKTGLFGDGYIETK